MGLYIIISAAGLLLGIFIGHLIDKPKLKQVEETNVARVIQRDALETHIQALSSQSNQLQQLIQDQGQSYQALIKESDNTQSKIDILKQSLDDLTEQQKTAAAAIYETAQQQAQEHYEQEMERLSSNLAQRREEINKTYLSLLNDAKEYYEEQTFDLNQNFSSLQYQYESMQQRLKDEQHKVDAAVEVAKRLNEQESNADFYRLNISDKDRQEIARLKDVLPWLRDQEPLNKVIYKCYYEKPYTDLVGRVVGQGIHSGIYKITNIENQMCYVGQSTNIAERWRQHIKRGIGAETPTRNKLYPVMHELGPENFTFEIIEECPTDKLNEREQYWQEFYHAKDWGYSIK